MEGAVQRMTGRQGVRAGRVEWRGDWLRIVLPLAGAVLAAVTLLCVPRLSLAATYKWVDEKGVIHYTDKLPPEEVNKANVELNKQGIPVKKTEPAPTPEQRRAKATSESEIDLARNRSLQTIDSVLKSAQAYSAQLTKRQADLEAKKKAEYSAKPAPAALERELEGITTELGRQADLIALKQRETVQVNAKYDTDKERWRALVAAKGGEPAMSAGSASNGITPAVNAGPYPGAATKTK